MRSNYESEARVIYLLTTDGQTVSYYSTINALKSVSSQCARSKLSLARKTEVHPKLCKC